MSATLSVRCPDCGHSLPFEVSFEPGERMADGGVFVDVVTDPDVGRRLVAHAALNPELHGAGSSQVG